MQNLLAFNVGVEIGQFLALAFREASLPFRENKTVITVPANKGLEYKLYLTQYASLIYEWSSDTALYFDLHGEPAGAKLVSTYR